MNRGKYNLSGEVVKALLHLPADLDISEVCYEPKHNIIEIYGYSEKFESVPECATPECTILGMYTAEINDMQQKIMENHERRRG